MADPAAGDVPPVETPEDDVDANYKPPPEKSLEEILSTDQEDESLRKYKEALLGDAKAGAVIVGEFRHYYSVSNKVYRWDYNYSFLLMFTDPNDQRKVLVKKLALIVEGRPEMELDLSGDLSQLKKQVRRYIFKCTGSVWF